MKRPEQSVTAQVREVYVVLWCGEYLEKESPDAIVFSEADAQALIASSPGQKESYDAERWPLATLLVSPAYVAFAGTLLRKIAAGDLAPLMLRDEAERQRRERK